MAPTSPLALARGARIAFRSLASASTETRQAALLAIANEIEKNKNHILASNQVDVQEGKKANLAESFIDRLMLNEERLGWITTDLRRVAELPDPVGEIFDSQIMPNGLKVTKAACSAWMCWL